MIHQRFRESDSYRVAKTSLIYAEVAFVQVGS